MKNLNRMKMYLAAVVCIGLLASCEKQDLTETDAKAPEGYMAVDDGVDHAAEDLIAQKEVAGGVVLHMHFKKDVPVEEQKRQWAEKVKEYMDVNAKQTRGTTSTFYHHLHTKTGTVTDQGTDGDVEVKIYYYTNTGYYSTGYRVLDNPGNDRERGDSDYYLLTSTLGTPISYARLNKLKIRLKGTDGRYISDMDTHVDSPILSSTGSSEIDDENCNVWLDSNTSSEWDYYDTGSIGSGTVYF